MSGATSYTWTLPPGWIGNSTSNSINATASSSGGNIHVTANNNCGSGAAQTIGVNVVVVPSTYSATNITVLNGQSICYNATQTITVAGNNTSCVVQVGGIATMIAGQNINYLPTTIVQHGGYMRGYITSVGPWCSTPSMPATALVKDDVPSSIYQSYCKVYPNPTTGKFILELTSYGDHVQVDIYGVCGEKVLSTILTGERKHEFVLSNRPVGVYFIRVVSGDRTETAKIIKQ